MAGASKGRIPESDIQAIRERTPIEEIVGDYVQLKPAGADSLKGLSPFKDEKTPSFHVRPQRGYFHCFSTGKGGDVFTFLMEMEHISFPEAVEVCADHIGYRINYQGGSTGARREEPGTRRRLIEANKAAHKFYREQLETPQAETARNFLLDRGFGQDIIYHFECGYAPEGWDTMTKHLLRLGFDFKELEAAGLSKMGRRGPIDRFHRRLLWPIKDLSGSVIGFGARKLFDDDNLGKYMNTPDTMLYHKSKVLFGLDVAKKDIAAKHQAVVVEGYTDVMAMHAAGVTTAVASCGTAFGADHLQVLRRLMLDDNFFRGELIYTFDGDEAGQKAAMRAFEGDQKFTGQSFVSVAPEGMDPCDLRLFRGDAAVRDLVADREPMFKFVIQTLLKDYSLDTVEGRLQALRRTVPVVAKINDPILQAEYARQLSGWIGWTDTDEVVRMVADEARRPAPQANSARRGRFSRPDDAPNTSPHAGAHRQDQVRGGQANPAQDQADPQTLHVPLPDPRDPHLWPQRESLKIALQYPELVGAQFDELGLEGFTHPAYYLVRKAIEEAGGAGSAHEGVDWIAAVADNVYDTAARSVISELAVEDIPVESDNLEAYAASALARLQEAQLGDKIAQLKSRLQRMRPSDDEQGYNALFFDLVQLEQQRRKLIDAAFRNGGSAF